MGNKRTLWIGTAAVLLIVLGVIGRNDADPQSFWAGAMFGVGCVCAILAAYTEEG